MNIILKIVLIFNIFIISIKMFKVFQIAVHLFIISENKMSYANKQVIENIILFIENQIIKSKIEGMKLDNSVMKSFIELNNI